MAYTPEERTAIIDSAIAKLGTLVQAVSEAAAEIVRLNGLLQNAVTLEEYNALKAQFDAASADLAAKTAELEQVDSDLARLKTAVES